MAKDNLTKNADIDITVREIDFVTRFARNWDALRDIMGIMRPVKKTAGTKLTSKRAKVTLADGNVAEGNEIPYSQATVEEIEYNTIAIKKYAKAVSIEAIDAKDYNNAVQRTDDEFLNELQGVVMDDFYTYLQTGTLKSTEGSFQMALAMSLGRVIDKWKKMHKGITGIVGFCNVLDAYQYLGAANITVQNQFGMNYIENFMGYNKLFLTSEIPQGTVIATPVDNIVLYYVDPADSQFARAGLSYTTDGDTNLIGFHVQGNYSTAVSESFALMGMTLFAEYLDGIAVVTFGQGGGANLASLKVGTLTLTPTFDPDTITYTAATTTATSKITATAEYADATIEIKNGSTVIENGGNASWSAGENTLTVKVTNDSVDKTYTVTVTKS
jgi:hypothetical protein